MERTSVIENIRHNFDFLKDAKASLFTNLETVIQIITPFINCIKENSENLNLDELNEILQYEIKMLLFISNITLVTMDFQKHNPPPRISLDKRRKKFLTPEEQLLSMLYKSLDCGDSSPFAKSDLANTIEYGRSAHNKLKMVPPSSNVTHLKPHVVFDTSSDTNTVLTNSVICSNTLERKVGSPSQTVITAVQSITLSNSSNITPNTSQTVTSSSDAGRISSSASAIPIIESVSVSDGLTGEKMSSTDDIESIKENMRKLSAKLEFISSSSESPRKLIPSLNYEYQLPEKDTPSVTPCSVVVPELDSSVVNKSSSSQENSSDDSFPRSILSDDPFLQMTKSEGSSDDSVANSVSNDKRSGSENDATTCLVEKSSNSSIEEQVSATECEADKMCAIETSSFFNEPKDIPEISKPVEPIEVLKQEPPDEPIISDTPGATGQQIKSSIQEPEQAIPSSQELKTEPQINDFKNNQVVKKVQFSVDHTDSQLSCASTVEEGVKSTNVDVRNLTSNSTWWRGPQNTGPAHDKLSKISTENNFVEKKEADKKVLPQLLLLPEERPNVIKNDLHISSKKKKRIKEKECNDKINDLKKPKIPEIGNWCVFSHVESPLEFYIELVDEENIACEEMKDIVNKVYRGTSSNYNSKNEAMSDLGQVCCAYIANYVGWFRVKILDWLPEHEAHLIVQTVDYGFKRTVSYKFLRKMTKDIADFPMLAIKCHFPLLFPPDSTYKIRLTEWPQSTINCLTDISGVSHSNVDYNFKLFKITFALQIDDSVAVDLFNVDNGNEAFTVRQTLIDLKLAVPIMDEYDEELEELEYFLEDIGEMEKADNITEAILGYDAQDEARICPFTTKGGTCFKGNNCKLEHRPLPKDGWTTDKISIINDSLYKILVPDKGEVCQVVITAYHDCCTFFAMIVRTPYQKNKLLFDKDFYELLETMNNKRNIRTYKSFKVWPAVGEVVIAMHTSGKWMRGVVQEFVLDKDEPKTAKVYMADFGDVIDVPLSDLREMPESFRQLPFQLVHMYLYNYQQKADCDLDRFRIFFQKHILRRSFFAEIMSDRRPPYRVRLTTLKGHDVGMKLEKEGFAKKRSSDIALNDDVSILLLE